MRKIDLWVLKVHNNVSPSKCQKRLSKRSCKLICLWLFRSLWEKVWALCLFFISCCCFLSQVTGPMILQVQKLRNISAPKANEESIHAPRLLKIQLTDGHLTCHGLENSSIPDLRYEVTVSKKWWFSQFYTMQG